MKPAHMAFWFCTGLTLGLLFSGQLLPAFFSSFLPIAITLEGLYGKH